MELRRFIDTSYNVHMQMMFVHCHHCDLNSTAGQGCSLRSPVRTRTAARWTTFGRRSTHCSPAARVEWCDNVTLHWMGLCPNRGDDWNSVFGVSLKSNNMYNIISCCYLSCLFHKELRKLKASLKKGIAWYSQLPRWEFLHQHSKRMTQRCWILFNAFALLMILALYANITRRILRYPSRHCDYH